MKELACYPTRPVWTPHSPAALRGSRPCSEDEDWAYVEHPEAEEGAAGGAARYTTYNNWLACEDSAEEAGAGLDDIVV